MNDTSAGWKWFSGSDGEHYSNTCDTREQAIAELDGFGGFICEARQDPLRMADWVDVPTLLENAEEDAGEFSNEDWDAMFVCTPEQQADLQSRLNMACDAWQAAHGLVFTPYCFTDTRNNEKISPDGAAL